jgi:hypothetical protein
MSARYEASVDDLARDESLVALLVDVGDSEPPILPAWWFWKADIGSFRFRTPTEASPTGSKIQKAKQ